MANSVVPNAVAYRPDIDGLRAVAVVAVLLFHCGVPGFSGGYVGVDVFFVISGYLITGHLAQEIAGGRMSVGRFYARRALRILPALFVTMMVTLALAAVLFLPSHFVQTSRALVAAAASVSNIYLWKTAGYFEPEALFQPLLHTWSLSVEEQFYAAVPMTMLLASRLIRQRWVLLFGPLCLLSFAVSVYATANGPTANFYLLPCRAWEMGMGSLLATIRIPAVKRRWMAEMLCIAGLLLLLAPIFLFDDATPFPGVNALYPCLGAALLIYSGQSSVASITSFLGSRPLVAVGLISYSLYLVHWPIIVFLRYEVVAPLTSADVAAVIVVSFLLATLSWRFVERPFRRRTAAFTPRRVLSAGAVLAVMVSLAGYAVIAGRGFPARFPGFSEQKIAGHELWKAGSCFLMGNPDYHRWSLNECTRIATGPRKVLLWGDSFAAQYVPGIIRNAEALNATVIQYTAAGCPPVLSYRSYARSLCSTFNAHALDVIDAEGIDTVILSGRWTDMRQRGLGEIKSTLRALDQRRVAVFVVGQSPEFAEDVQVIDFLKGDKAPDAVNRWGVFFGPELNSEILSIVGAGRFVDPMPPLCDGSVCTYKDRGVFLFEDYGHFSAAGSSRVVSSLFVEKEGLSSP